MWCEKCPSMLLKPGGRGRVLWRVRVLRVLRGWWCAPGKCGACRVVGRGAGVCWGCGAQCAGSGGDSKSSEGAVQAGGGVTARPPKPSCLPKRPPARVVRACPAGRRSAAAGARRVQVVAGSRKRAAGGGVVVGRTWACCPWVTRARAQGEAGGQEAEAKVREAAQPPRWRGGAVRQGGGGAPCGPRRRLPPVLLQTAVGEASCCAVMGSGACRCARDAASER